jgi:hypothetical protein
VLKKLLLLLAMFVPLSAGAQTCMSASCVAASASESDFLNALPASGNTNATVTVHIPSDTEHWTTQLTYSQPTAVTKIIIQGNTSLSCTGTPGTSGYGCTATDHTVIIDDIPGNFGVVQLNSSSSTSNPTFEFSGVTIQGGTGATKFQGDLLFYSNSAQATVRVYGNHFNQTTGGTTGWAGRFNGCWSGVVTTNVFDNASPTDTTSVVQGFMHSNTCNDSLGFGDGSWFVATGFGNPYGYIYEENNVFNGGLFGDCIISGKFVARYNTFNSNSESSSWIHTHGTAQNNGRVRSCRAIEVYHNYFNPTTVSGSDLIGNSGGPELIWGNTVAILSKHFIAVGDERNDAQHGQTATPNGWGYCGIGALNPSGPTSGWDENVDSTGRACVDGIGRGQGLQHANGVDFPGALNSSTGTIAWLEQYLEPVYSWMNSVAGTPLTSIVSPATVLGRDLIVDNASFTGASGTGYGTLASIPATCTPGPGGPYGASPTGSYGVLYFATDANGGIGEAYACTALNTWTPIYEPYTYPYPSSGTTFFSLSATVTGSGSCSIDSTNNCSSNSYASGTPIGPCHVTTSGGSTLTGWSTTGSAPSCPGTGTCPTSGTFNLASNSSITATCSGGTPVCADPFQTGPNYSGAGPGPSGAYYGPPAIPIGFTSTTAGCVMHARFDGVTAGCGDTTYSGTSSISTNTTASVIACQGGYTPSGTAGGFWNILAVPYPPIQAVAVH